MNSTVKTCFEIDFLILASALEESKAYATRARRRAASYAAEARSAEEEVLRKANELEAMRAEFLRRAA
jgi:hypothetical protein